MKKFYAKTKERIKVMKKTLTNKVLLISSLIISLL